MENNFFSFFFHFFSIQITNLILQNMALAHQFFFNITKEEMKFDSKEVGTNQSISQ